MVNVAKMEVCRAEDNIEDRPVNDACDVLASYIETR